MALLTSIQVLAAPARDCTQVISNVERLACFDAAAGTPAHVAPITGAWSLPEHHAPSLARIMANEAQRTPQDLGFRISVDAEGTTGRHNVVISAPAIAATEPPPYLAISCVQNISRLQLLTGQPIEPRRVELQLRGDGRATSRRPWQVMENGQVLDAGRGLPAIEQIKALRGTQRIHVSSDYPPLNGLIFDAQGLDPLIEQARKACHW